MHGAGPCFAQAALDRREEPRRRSERAEQVLLRGVKGMPEAPQRLPVPAEHLVGRDEQAGILGGLQEETEREGVRRGLRVGQVEAKAGARRARLRAERGPGPGVEIASERSLLEPFGREGGIGPAKRGDEPPLPGEMRGFPVQRAEAHRGPHERVGRRIEERPEQRLGRPHLRRPGVATLPVRAGTA